MRMSILMVEEPTGSVCSYRQNKTPGGGLLVGDPNAVLSPTAGGSHCEVYSCVEAFLEIIAFATASLGPDTCRTCHGECVELSRSENQQHIHKVIPLDENGALFLSILTQVGDKNDSPISS